MTMLATKLSYCCRHTQHARVVFKLNKVIWLSHASSSSGRPCASMSPGITLNLKTTQKSRGYCSHPVSRFPVPDKKDLPQDIQDAMTEVEEKSGFLPNVFKTLSHRPAEFRAFFNYYDALMMKESGSLTKADKEMIVTATSAANNCLYCVVAHGALMRIYSKNSLTADQVATNWEKADLDDRQKAILTFAMDVCNSKPINESHFTELENHGLDREDAWDIGAIAAFFAMSNRMAHLTDMRPNDEFYLLGRVPREKKQK